MKKVLLAVIALITMINFQSCLEDSCTEQRSFVVYAPVYLTKAQFRRDIEATSVRVLENPGKMYFHNQYMFINEQGKGIHVYDVSDITNPVKVTFYDIPGNFDMAIKDNILYADNVIDLIAVDINNVMQPALVKRIEDFRGHYINYDPQQYYAYSIKSNQTQILDCTNPNFGRDFFLDDGFANFDASASPESSVINTNLFSGTGVGGSFARFTVVNDYLYVVDQSSLKSFLVSEPANPELKNTNQFGWGIETIFPYKDKLFVGTNSGMYIFNNSNPVAPYLLSAFEHARACDPVIVHDNTAYVTLRSGNTCQGFTNQLDVIDITNILQPKLIKSYPMINPHGLSYNNDHIFLAEGESGFKVLDVKDPNKVSQICHIKDVHSYDMISLSDQRLFMIGNDGFYQYDVTNPASPVLKSSIKINQ